MALPTGAIIGILVDNLRLRKSVIPLSKRKMTGWAEGLELPRGGETVLYTGLMYQLMPSIVAMANLMGRFENSPIRHLMGLGRLANKVVNLSFFMARSRPEIRRAYDVRLRAIAELLLESGVEFGYLADEELYSGALVYDNGMMEVFRRHARRVRDALKRRGVRRVITVDPHTLNMFRDVYPKLIEGFDIGAESYLEVLARRGMETNGATGKTVVIHDSCVYARYEDVLEQPRALLRSTGAEVREPDYSRTITLCCGGPIESLFPSRSKEVARERIGQLAACGSDVAVMCPICLFNLTEAAETTGADVRVRDICEYLSEARPS
ncbi:MAG TPA: (Fe-S)-binding protein [bacterium]|nr:(Fe-S)-binding protein [bacterium]